MSSFTSTPFGEIPFNVIECDGVFKFANPSIPKPLLDLTFQSKEEASTFSKSIALNSALYSMTPNIDFENCSISIEKSDIEFVMGEEKYPLLDDETVVKRLHEQFEKNGIIDISLEHCGQNIGCVVAKTLFNGYEPEMDIEGERAVRYYGSDRGCNAINNILVGNWEKYGPIVSGALKKQVEHTLNLYENMKPLDKDLRVHRRTKKSHYNLDEIESVDCKHFASTAVIMASTEHFKERGADLAMDMLIPKGTPVAWIGLDDDGLSDTSGSENEVILPPMKYKVLQKGEDTIKLGEPEMLDIYQQLLCSLNVLKQNSKEQEFHEIDQAATVIKMRVTEKYANNIPNKYKGLYEHGKPTVEHSKEINQSIR